MNWKQKSEILYELGRLEGIAEFSGMTTAIGKVLFTVVNHITNVLDEIPMEPTVRLTPTAPTNNEHVYIKPDSRTDEEKVTDLKAKMQQEEKDRAEKKRLYARQYYYAHKNKRAI